MVSTEEAADSWPAMKLTHWTVSSVTVFTAAGQALLGCVNGHGLVWHPCGRSASDQCKCVGKNLSYVADLRPEELESLVSPGYLWLVGGVGYC
jgi:hypothetical protein